MCKENLELYDKFRVCPKEAQKPISAGRLKGMTDINPMWRIKALTEAFGPCGIGWTTKILNTWIDEGSDGERIANVHIALRIKYNGEWSEPIEGIGGAMQISSERNGLHTDDECYKKAYTDAMSVACKALGIAADVYWSRDPESKYQTASPAPEEQPPAPPAPPIICKDCGKTITDDMAARTQKAFGVTLCKECGMIRHNLMQAMNEANQKLGDTENG